MVRSIYETNVVKNEANVLCRGPLLFSLLLSFLLARGAREEQEAAVFSGVFAMIWIGSAVVTLQIKLLGGSMYVLLARSYGLYTNGVLQLLLPVSWHHRLHALPTCNCRSALLARIVDDTADTDLHSACGLVISCGNKHLGWQWSCEK